MRANLRSTLPMLLWVMVLLIVYAISARAQATTTTTSTAILLLTKLTVIEQLAPTRVTEKINSNHLRFKTNAPNTEVSWQVPGMGHAAFANKNRLAIEEVMTEGERGRRLHLNLFGQLEAKGIAYTRVSPLKQKITQR